MKIKKSYLSITSNKPEKQISLLARQYLLAADRCMDKKSFTYKQNFEALFVPAFVLSAFSAELSIKFILRSNNIKATGHKLKILFGKLPVDDQKEMYNLFEMQSDDFGKYLTDIDKVFEDWRYVYEENKNDQEIDPIFLRQFALGLLVVSKKYKK